MNPPGQAAAATKPSPCLARQPILTQDEKVFGYELLFRESPEDNRFSSDAENATCSVIDALNVMGLDVVCDGRLVFINCTHQMLLKEYFFLLPPDKVVVEIQENVPAEQNAVAACQQLKQKRYRIALDNFLPGDAREPLIPYADFIKVDIRRITPEQSAATAARYASTQRHMLAQRVETRVQFLNAHKDGFTLFQGYFFRHPERMRARHIPANQASYLHLLQAISAPQVDMAGVEDLIKRDPSLCYRLLRYLNSPLLGLSSPVQSVRHAMSLLGERELVRWIRMATTLAMGQDKCSDLVLSSLVRARFCELIATKVIHGKSDLFLMGMLSLMDSILEMPMGVVVEGLAIDPDTKAQLLAAKTGKKTPLSPVFDLMITREAGDWEGVTALAKKLDLSLPCVNRAYNEAMSWAHEMASAVPPQDH
jgi:EAL and modified HD-GYP domain-containing signal transduction protein